MKKTLANVTFAGYNCNVNKTTYSNGYTALLLEDAIEGDCVAVVSINMLSQGRLSSNRIYVKDYSENEGILEVLQKAGVLSEPLGYAQAGFELVPICEILEPEENTLNIRNLI